jgi:serum/glucocorticoid-regulated kinase 2
MSWKLGKSKASKTTASSLSIQDMDARSTTPTPRNPDGDPQFRSGLLIIHVNRAEGLELPAGTALPPAVKTALESQQAKAAASVSPSSVTQQRLAKGKGNRDSIQRTQCWWLPYLVMEFEVNQVLLTPLGGDVAKPVYMYQATL